MAQIAKQLTELIGNTPLLELNKYSQNKGLQTPVIAKVEFFNPGGSVKDRIALAMIEDAEQRGILKPGATIIEPTSGNTGVGLALVSAVKGYKLILTMPDTMSIERRNLVKAYGAEVRLTPGKDGMPGAIREAEALRNSIPGAVILQQFENPANPAKHYATTGPEIWRDTDGQVDIVIFVPKTYEASVIDEVFDVENDDAIRTGREIAQQEGLLVGISAGAALYAAIQVASRPENKNKRIVVLLPDTGERYLSTVLYDFENYPL